MDGDTISNIKRLESILAAKEARENASASTENYGKGEMSNLSPESPIVQKLKQDRVIWETQQREIAEQKKQIEQFKIRKAKRIQAVTARQVTDDKQRKLKATIDVINKINTDIGDAQQCLGKLLKYIGDNERLLEEQVYFKGKSQRLKRMITAFYFGLKNSPIKPSQYFDEK